MNAICDRLINITDADLHKDEALLTAIPEFHRDVCLFLLPWYKHPANLTASSANSNPVPSRRKRSAGPPPSGHTTPSRLSGSPASAGPRLCERVSEIRRRISRRGLLRKFLGSCGHQSQQEQSTGHFETGNARITGPGEADLPLSTTWKMILVAWNAAPVDRKGVESTISSLWEKVLWYTHLNQPPGPRRLRVQLEPCGAMVLWDSLGRAEGLERTEQNSSGMGRFVFSAFGDGRNVTSCVLSQEMRPTGGRYCRNKGDERTSGKTNEADPTERSRHGRSHEYMHYAQDNTQLGHFQKV